MLYVDFVMNLLALGIAGTLVIAIPNRDGLTIVADGLSTVGGKPYPSGPKLHTIENFKQTVFTITGTANFLPLPPPNVDLANFILTAKPNFSGEDILSEEISRHGDKLLEKSSLELIANKFLIEFGAFLGSRPPLVGAYKNQEICRSVIIQYDVNSKVSQISQFILLSNPDGSLFLGDRIIDRCSASGPRTIWRFGESKYVEQNVLLPDSAGWPLLIPEIGKLWNEASSASDLNVDGAVRIGVGLIKATEYASKTVPIKTAVGGIPMILHLTGITEPKNLHK